MYTSILKKAIGGLCLLAAVTVKAQNIEEHTVVLGKDIAEEDAYHPDIYSKGSFFMHTLRYVMGACRSCTCPRPWRTTVTLRWSISGSRAPMEGPAGIILRGRVRLLLIFCQASRAEISTG